MPSTSRRGQQHKRKRNGSSSKHRSAVPVGTCGDWPTARADSNERSDDEAEEVEEEEDPVLPTIVASWGSLVWFWGKKNEDQPVLEQVLEPVVAGDAIRRDSESSKWARWQDLAKKNTFGFVFFTEVFCVWPVERPLADEQ